jgi:carboxyl-terminal processing protease
VDPHTYISPTDYFKNVSSNNERSKYFLGLSFEKKNSRIYLKKVYKNSDADFSGLKSNDEVISISGQSLKNMTLSEVSDLLRDKNKKVFPLVIRRNQSAFVKKLIRTYRTLNQVQSEVLDVGQKIGYIQLSKFAYNICENVRNEIQKMQPATLSGLVLDLRDNPGGLLTEAACLAGLFIGEGKTIFSIKYLQESHEEVALTTSEQVYFGPVTVLTNNSSASAAELIAGALQEYKRATIIGERTFGKGTFQEIESWENSAEISLFSTKGFYLLPSGFSTQTVGVTPDIILADESAPRSEFDNYLFPLVVHHEKNLSVDKKSKESSSRFSNNCVNLSNSKFSDDIFVATAQKVLSCAFSLSAQLELDVKNINL